ncbi:adenosylcobinamide-phosphate synthase CbiB [Effusibacillus lacus]|uniref:Cobalamin biosynthesis protein CobD n=1 Tax=Effusibacillus lacus TaxID=1348429 RepID=A0A292YG50_9BACL|nr:adenosylcobinamide-phosphate synthase CbiB [Effusibacillus lacus]TCS70836.1 adenosylcobinamide-phosphate synthase [Effusibacillus lacus]GAX89367.1 cobalamin biosynthesis protein [Effusibacillus lacus]
MIQVYAAFLVDLLIGDPRWIPHPVIMIGKMIAGLESLLRKIFRIPVNIGEPVSSVPDNSREAVVSLSPEQRQYRERWAGILLVLLVVGTSTGIASVVLWAAFQLHPWLAVCLNVWFISTTIAARGLAEAGNGIRKALEQGDLEEARKRAGWIVSRDTTVLPGPEVARAAVESVAENIVDAVISPLFYAMIGGAPLAMAYRAANTLDSMVGYRNDRYLYFGWASARLDDLLNWIPARLSGLLVVASAWILRYSPAGAWKTIRRDAAKHPSPNSGIPEAGVAGALGIRLGGVNIYHGRESFRAYMGESLKELSPVHIKHTIHVLYVASALMLLLGGITTFIYWLL